MSVDKKTVKQKSEETETEKIEVKRKITIPGEKIVSGRDFLPGEGTIREGEDIVARRFGLADISGRLVKIIPLSGTYIPRTGNIVIGRVEDVTFNGWIIDLKAPYSSFLSLSECSRYIKGDLTEYYNIGDILVCKVFSIRNKSIDLTIKGRGLGKLERGQIIYINSNKVPRVIGREGSMIRIIKQETGCEITVGQNGVVWILGNKIEDELRAKEAISFIVSKSYIEGLTDKVQDFFKNKKEEK
ncbi:MAG: exosome complex RNA-binding protein Rrp4 [Nanoarchaeota archaeon]